MQTLLLLVRELDRRGISWGWVNDHSLQSGKIGMRTLVASGGSYQAILVPNAPMIEQQTLRVLAELSAAAFPSRLPVSCPRASPVSSMRKRAITRCRNWWRN